MCGAFHLPPCAASNKLISRSFLLQLTPRGKPVGRHFIFAKPYHMAASIRAAALLLAALLLSPARAAQFEGLGFLPDGTTSNAFDVSADGSVIVGGETDFPVIPNGRPFLWTAQTGMWTPQADYPFLSGGMFNAVSADGRTAVGGAAYFFSPGYRGVPTRWTADDGLQRIAEDVQSKTWSASLAISPDGGWCLIRSLNSSFELGTNISLHRWNTQTGTQLLDPSPQQSINSLFWTDVSSGGGRVIARDYIDGNYGGFLWDESDGYIPLGFSYPYRISPDGATAIGWDYHVGNPNEAVRWTEATGPQLLGIVPGHAGSAATGISADAQRIVGNGTPDLLNPNDECFIWDPLNGIRDLNQVLSQHYDLADQLAGWSGKWVNALSDDGRTIVGWGTDPDGHTQAFRIVLNATGDANDDGLIDGADYTLWADHFQQDNPLVAQGDFNTDGKVDGADYTLWADHYQPVASAALPVPEPTAWALALVGAASAVLHYWRAGRRV
jgi:uncharacterized membrane protein